MRVALISQEFPPAIDGGAGIYAQELASGLLALGIDVTIFTVSEASHQHNVVPVSSFSDGAISFWTKLPRIFANIVRKSGPFDIIHGNCIADLSLIRYYGCRARVVTVHHVTRSLVKQTRATLQQRIRDIRGEMGLVPFLEGHVMRRADRVIAVSEMTRKDVVDYCGVVPNNVHVIHNGLTATQTGDKTIHKEIRSRVSAPHESIILSVGRLEYRKGTDILLRAFARVQQAPIASRLLLAGGGAVDEYKTLARELGIADHVTFLGRVDDRMRNALYAASDVFVLASRFEGFGFVPLEAMSFGKPIVMTKTGIAIDGLVSSKHGAIVETEAVEPLADAIIRLLSNPAQRRAIGAANRNWVKTRFSWQNAASATKDAYDFALAAHKSNITPRY